MKSVKMYILSLFLFVFNLTGSEIPEYLITSIDGSKVTLENGSIFRLQIVSSVFHEGDLVRLQESVGIPSFEFKNGMPVMLPLLALWNITTERLIPIDAIENIGAVVTISNLDSERGLVTLSDATVWNVSEMDKRFLTLWNIGDPIFVGKNGNPNALFFDGVLFDSFSLTASAAKQVT